MAGVRGGCINPASGGTPDGLLTDDATWADGGIVPLPVVTGEAFPGGLEADKWL